MYIFLRLNGAIAVCSLARNRNNQSKKNQLYWGRTILVRPDFFVYFYFDWRFCIKHSNIKSYFHKQKLWSLISYQPRWGLTLKGWLLTICSFMAVSIFLGFNIYSFLAPVAPIKAEALVVEGWIDDDGIKGAIAQRLTS